MTTTLRLNPHLTFDGRCKEAFQFYERSLDGKILTMLPYGETPMVDQAPQEWRSKILHATLTIDGNVVLYGADALPGQYRVPAGFHITIGTKDPDRAKRIFQALSEGGTVQMALQKTFWAALFGVVIDRYGVSWEINCEQAQ